MPVRGERGAPIFDPQQHSTIRKFFAQLEALFARCQIASDIERKLYTTLFPNSDVTDTWEALSEYSDPRKTYADLKARLFDIYNQSSLRYTHCDLERFICDQIPLDLRSQQALSEFHLRFNAISTYLLDLGHISMREQSAMYLRGFHTSLRSKIDFRLQIKYPDHSLSLPHSIYAIFEAAQWISQDPTIRNSIATPTMHIPVNAIIMRSPAEENANWATPARFSTPSASISVSNSTKQLGAIFSAASEAITDAISEPDHVQPSETQCEHPTSTIFEKTIKLPHQVVPIAPALPLRTVAVFANTSPLHSYPLASHSVPSMPPAVQRRINAIEEELRVLRAQSEVLTTPIRSASSANRSDANLSTSNLPDDSPLASSPPKNPIQLPSNSDQPASIFGLISSISHPATFAHQGRLYHAIQWTPRHRIWSMTSTPAMRNAAKISISTHKPSTANMQASISDETLPIIPPKLNTLISVQKQVLSDSTSDSTSLVPVSTHDPLPLSTTPPTLRISTSQPSDSPIAPPSPSISHSPASHSLVFALGISRTPSPASTELPHTRTTLPSSPILLGSIYCGFPRFSLRYRTKYIRNHARLKGMRCETQF